MNELNGKVAIVVGASRGLGRGITEAFLDAGAHVVAVARNLAPLTELASRRPELHLVAGDGSDPMVAGSLLSQNSPDVLALVAGAVPLLRPIHHHTWETFSVNWESDTRMAFNWIREALLLPLRRGAASSS